MKKVLLAAAATLAFVSAASADYVDRDSGVLVPENVYGQAQTARGASCSDAAYYTMGDPDPSIRLELQRDCAVGGPDGGGAD